MFEADTDKKLDRLNDNLAGFFTDVLRFIEEVYKWIKAVMEAKPVIIKEAETDA
jgi:hypothetical protein